MTNVVHHSAEAGGDQGGQSVARGRYWVRAVERTVQLLEAVAEDAGRGKTLGEVARKARMPEPSTLRYLATLTALGFVEHESAGEEGRYRLGIEAFSLAKRAIGNPDIRGLALPHMQGLLHRYEETVNLAVFRQRRLVIIEVLEGLRSIRQGARVGERDRLRSTALGKAILATYSDEEALELVRSEPLERFTPRTIMDEDHMLRELKSIRSRGFAIDDEESEVGLRCVGVAIPVHPGYAFGLSISGPSHLFTRELARGAGPVLCLVKDKLLSQLTTGGRLRRVR
jgi:DNA-binding IclR family transcriptional regulator